MIETLFQNPRKLKAHLSAPLLNEREAFLEKKKSEGNGLRSLQMTADQLCFAATHLASLERKHIIPLSEITALRDKWRGPKTNFFVSTVIQWLDDMDVIDPTYDDKTILFNQFCSVCYYRLKYLTYPLFEERLSYLKERQANGMAFSCLHEYAWMQLQVIDRLKLSDGGKIHADDIDNAVQDRIREDCSVGQAPSIKWIKTFKAVAYGWLSYMGALYVVEPSSPPGYDYVCRYLHWAKESKGLADITLEGRERELRCLMYFLHDMDNLHFLSLEHIDNYIGYRHNCGLGRRSIATAVSTLRDFIKYMSTLGICTINPRAIRAPRQYSMESLPSSPSWDDVNRLASYYGTSNARGRRNTAIIALMAVYGMRSSEVANIKTQDIDWEKEVIYLNRAKRGGMQAFPLTRQVESLIIDYVINGRNNTMGRDHLFLTLFMPYKSISKDVIYNVVSRAYTALKVNIRHKGGHSLRHACATRIVNNGGTLKEASDLLGHRLFDTTRIYAKTDLANLRKVADMEWEGLL